ncbi:ZP domain-containing protein [Trichonephila clavata]|uniref:ZP domain-containing protein n=1 Tax=Trichonephila clavata TaxID=2740835 RepID=A0A8X6L1R2_TRICU|nr:ZP domain-containing protein [Trichonephila clavata]
MRFTRREIYFFIEALINDSKYIMGESNVPQDKGHNSSHFPDARVFYNVTCGSDLMQVTLNLTNHPASIVYLQNLKGYPGCEPKAKDNLVIFQLSLNESGTHCGVSKMLNKQSGHNIYYQRVVIEKSNQKEKDLLFLQCVIPGDFNMEFVRLDWLRESVPYNFSEPTSSPISVTPDIVPYVNMAIRDKGLQLDTSAIVHPGTMLDLLIYLDKESSAHYDISLRYLTLSDATRSQEEVVVMNGCSVDPFVLDVFPPIDGVLRSQFRAFKFQSSDFVIFLATVSVCLQQCVEVECYGEPDQSGRRKREIPKFLPHYTNEAFEVEISAFLRIKADVEGDIVFEESECLSIGFLNPLKIGSFIYYLHRNL